MFISFVCTKETNQRKVHPFRCHGGLNLRDQDDIGANVQHDVAKDIGQSPVRLYVK